MMTTEKRSPRRRGCLLVLPGLLMTVVFLVMLQISFHHRVDLRDAEEFVDLPPHMIKEDRQKKATSSSSSVYHQRRQEQQQNESLSQKKNSSVLNEDPWMAMLERAKDMLRHCNQLLTTSGSISDFTTELVNQTASPRENISMAQLPAFGIIQAINAWKSSSSSVSSPSPELPPSNSNLQCQLPPETECQETHVTAIYMGYKENRLQYLVSNIGQKVTGTDWQSLVQKVILVYNGPPKHFVVSDMGRRLVKLSKTFPDRFEIFPVLQHDGFTNHLMNRYHPKLNVTTKSIIYYDDDGPFLTFNATLAAFELWKRNAQAQVGALGRSLDLSPRQELEKNALRQKLQLRPDQEGRFFVSHCPGPAGVGGSIDLIEYNFKTFPNFGAIMVLPSNTFMHAGYRCFLWHPMLQELRHFVATHPVYPDDLLVSMIISQLSGRAPRIYSRRFRPVQQKQANVPSSQTPANASAPQPNDKLSIPRNAAAILPPARTNSQRRQRQRPHRVVGSTFHTELVLPPTEAEVVDTKLLIGDSTVQSSLQRHIQQRRRRLLWKDTSSEEVWANRRSHAANMIAAYFGSLNSGSLGWCAGTKYFHAKMDTCEPFLAEVGMLPWMQSDNSPRTTCP